MPQVTTPSTTTMSPTSKECKMCLEFQQEPRCIPSKNKRIQLKPTPGFQATCSMQARSQNWRASNRNLKAKWQALRKRAKLCQKRLLWASRILTTIRSLRQRTKTSIWLVPLTTLLTLWWRTCREAWTEPISCCRDHPLCWVMKRGDWLRNRRGAECQWQVS